MITMNRIYLLLCIIGLGQCYTIERITEPLDLGEGPHWNAFNQILYFVDITNGTINLYDPATKEHNSTTLGSGPVSFIIPVAGTTDEFLVSTGLDIRHITWDGQNDSQVQSSILYTATQKHDGSRFNDAKVDRIGQLWAGTMGPEPTPNNITLRTGKLYSVASTTPLKSHLENILISNGLAWTIDGSVMYYIDSGDYTVDKFDFNPTDDESLRNRQTIFNLTKEGLKGLPDGMTIDTKGNLWIACYGGYQVIVVNPDEGKLVKTIPINASQVTSVTWGGANLNELYVTSARIGLSADEIKKYPHSGSTFRITDLGARGYPGDNYGMYTQPRTSGYGRPNLKHQH
ncbi:regucalcin-like isoform X2 [Orussus abietinus]|uniref:regucalcin-like isoform X2 n=1 Tax=Orussus abietinus TaxID=222816 RepID=UPI0006255963|nr:regucalcin-like isoform X2 [Orussus abietinus]